MYPSIPCGFLPRNGSLSDDAPFELGDGAKNLNHKCAHCRSRIQWLSQRSNQSTCSFDLIQDRQQILK